MKKILSILLCFIAFATGWSQKIYFPKANYADSVSVAKNLPVLADKIIAVYKSDNREDYLADLYKLEFVTHNYKAMLGTINKYGQEIFGDSIKNKKVGFPYRIYVNTLNKHPKTKAEFDSVFAKTFRDTYKELDNYGEEWVEGFYKKSTADIKSIYESKLAAIKVSDSIPITDAIMLCRNYAAYVNAAATGSLAKKLLIDIENEKFIIDENIIITLPNGSTIAGTLVLNKKTTAPQPVVMMYNIYAGIEIRLCKEMAAKGYAGFMANTRGKRLSKDAIEPYEHDGEDAYHIIDWISKQPWCNGKVGMYGGSYLGFSQWSAMKKVHPALKTIVPQVAVGAGIDFPMQNGIFMSYALRWIHFVANNKLIDMDDFANDKKWDATFGSYFKNGSSFRSLDSIDGAPSPLFQRWLDHPGYDSYWQNMTPQQDAFANINIPILTTTGYYDDDQLGAMYYYNQYQKWNKSNNYYLVIGPYDHGGAQGYPKKELGGYTLDKEAVISINSLIFEWFDYILKDGKRPEILKDKVNFQVMGKNEWKHVPTLEQMHNATLTFYLGNENNNPVLLKTAPKTSGSIFQTVDFKDRSEVNIYKDTDVCGFPLLDNTVLKTEKQQLVFESNPIEEPFAISGSMTASLKASCNKKDMDIAIQLYEKTPDGHYFALNNNQQRASYAKDRTKRQLLQPNKIETINMNQNFITSKQLQKGSRIVIVMGVNKNPNWQVNYGTGKDVSEETINDAAIPLEVKWYSDSSITIPILK